MTGRRLVGGVAVICATGAALAGCGSSSGPSASGSARVPTVASLSRAADVSSSASGYRVRLRLDETVPGAGAIGATANGSFTPADRFGSMTMRMSLPASGGLGELQFQAVMAGDEFYLRLPSQVAGRIPGGRPWVSINVAQVAQAAGLPGVGSLMSSSASMTDPGQYLSFLRATSTGSVQDLGAANVDGHSTTGYRAEVDLAKLPEAVPAADRRQAQQLVAALQSKGAVTQLPIEVWIDRSQLIRRIRLSFTQSLPTGQSASLSMTEDFLQYGPQPAPMIPSPGETTDLLSLLSQGGLSG